MIEWLFRHLARILVRLFYARIEVANNILANADPAAILIPNHPNGVLDAAIIYAVLGRPVAMLSKSTPYASLFSGWVLRRFGTLPIYRKKDIGLRGGAKDPDDMQKRNEETFRQCRKLLRRGTAITLFPEGLTHAAPKMAPIRTGTARIALSTAASMDWEAPELIPIGLWYENPTRFRSFALVIPGEPILVAEFRDQYEQSPQNAVRDMTARIEQRLREVVLEAETAELLKSVRYIATWTDPASRKPDLTARHVRTAELLAGYRKMRTIDPKRIAQIEEAARAYAQNLIALGIRDPWKLVSPKPVSGYAVRRVLLLLAWSPLALVGAMLSYFPYHVSGYVARYMFPHNRALASGYKLTAGTIVIVATWILEVVVVGIFLGAHWGVLLLLLAPLCSYMTIRWAEVARKVHAVIRAGWMRRRRKKLVDHLTAQRQKLCNDISEAMAHLETLS